MKPIEKSIEEIDRNFAIETELGRDDIRFFDVKRMPTLLYGLQYDKTRFYRMPEDFAASVNQNIASLNRHTSGGRIRFRTNSPFVAVSVKMPRDAVMWHMPVSGASGFDLYVDGRFYRMFRPSASERNVSYDRIVDFHDETPREREILIHFPLYDWVDAVYVGLQEGAQLWEARPYRAQKPIVFYGSSITQGGCVSRPGLAYPAHISRWLDCDYINLGFSGNAKGELAMAEYIASLDSSVFVMDYDHNTPTYEHLAATHEAFYKHFRALRPEIPVVMVSAPDFHWYPQSRGERRDLIRQNYETAASGDTRVFFVDGETLMDGDDWDSCSVDACHPNDIGHYRMAKGIAPAVEQALRSLQK